MCLQGRENEGLVESTECRECGCGVLGGGRGFFLERVRAVIREGVSAKDGVWL